MDSGGGPVYEPKRQFSPPLIDSPELRNRSQPTQHQQQPNQMDYNGYDQKPMMGVGGPVGVSNQYQQPQQYNRTQQWHNEHLKNINNNNQHFERRKVSVQANFYNYNMPYDQRPREQARPMMDFPPSLQPAANDQRWRKPCLQMQAPQMQRKTSIPLEISPPIFEHPAYTETMLSPNHPSSLLKIESPCQGSPMEIDAIRKKSSQGGFSGMQPPPPSHSAKKHPNIPSRKASLMATKSKLRAPRFGESTTYTPPPILSPMRNGSGLFWQIAKSLAQNSQAAPANTCGDETTPGLYNGEDIEMNDDDSPGVKMVDEMTSSSVVDTPPMESGQLEHQPLMSGQSQAEGGASGGGNGAHPARKNGFFYMASQINQANFADELEALRKESIASTSSHRSIEEVYRKFSTGGSATVATRKESTVSNAYDLEEEDEFDNGLPRTSDANPHINIGSRYQAKVFKWRERVIIQAERDLLEDRDQLIFGGNIMNGLDEEQVKAFELLACSQATPKPGRNKELALHLLMENRGNIEAAVTDLLRSDTLDWEQYPIIYGSNYVDSTPWSPEDIQAFQDAIYKTEKDFYQVSQELTGKSVRQCIEFYYTWKKTCPDDYRKLRNLRRKRQLLELNLQQMDDNLPMKKCSLEEVPEEPCSLSGSTTAAPYQGLQDYVEPRPRNDSFHLAGASSMSASPLRDICTPSMMFNKAPSPAMKDITGIQRNYQPSAARCQPSVGKKGAQPSADGFFHCRLCDKCFEKVKSLNAHMKSHAMKARAEAEAKAQVDAQMTQNQQNHTQQPHQPQHQQQNHMNGNLFQNNNSSMSMSTVPQVTIQNMGMQHSPTLNGHGIGIAQNLLSQPGIGLVHPRPQHPLIHQTPPISQQIIH